MSWLLSSKTRLLQSKAAGRENSGSYWWGLEAVVGRTGNGNILPAILKYYSIIKTWQKYSIKSKIVTWTLTKEGFPEREYLNEVLGMNRQKN